MSTFDILLEKPAYGGESMGRLPDGRAVFVPFGLPGEKVRIRLSFEKQNFARGELLEVLEPSPQRIPAACRHFGRCGGCHYQNLPYEEQLKVKREVLRDQLQRIGGIKNPPVAEAVASPSAWNYRNHVQFHVNEDGRLGFVAASRDGILPVEECRLPEPAIAEFWPSLQFDTESGIQRVALRAGLDGELMVLLESDDDLPPEVEIEAEVSVVHLFEDNPVVMAGQGFLTERVLEQDFMVSAASFFQVNRGAAEKMVRHLLENLGLTPDSVVMDVYCGAGLFSKFLAPLCKEVIGIEESPAACEDFGVNLDEFGNVSLYEGAAEDILPALKGWKKVSHLIVDPPRAGLDKRALDAILALKPAKLAYVSCDPSTLGRDAARLVQGGYRLTQSTPFDLFPQTYHIESITFFEAA